MTLLTERRRSAFEGELLQRAGLAFLLVAVLSVLTNLGAILALRFPDPDDVLRLQQVRDLLAGQGWFDLTQHRVDSPNGGVPMHWSRLVDIPLAASLLVFTPLLGQSSAEAVTLVLIPLLTLAIALLLAGRIAWRLIGAEATGFACLALALSVPVVSQLRPLRIDHHGWQIVLALVAANGLMARNPRVGGWVIGLALAAWMSISLEGLPMAAAFIGVLALRWLKGKTDRQWLFHAMLALAAGSLALFLGTRGVGEFVNHCDAISPVHLTVFAWGAVGIAGMATFRPHPVPFQIMGFALIAAGALAIVYFAAPQCTSGSFSALDPVVRQYWYSHVIEGLPIWQQRPQDILPIVVPPLIGLVAAIRLGAQSTDWLRRFWFDYALLIAAALAVAVFVARAGAVAGALAAPPLGWQIANWYHALRRMRRTEKRIAAFVAIALALVPALPFTLLALAVPAKAQREAVAISRAADCDVPSAARELGQLGRAEVLAPLDISPRIVLDSELSVVATGHHRGNAAMRELITTFLGSSADARRSLRTRGTKYVALCPGLAEMAQYAHHSPSGFAAELRAGRVQEWLRPVFTEANGEFRVWQVID
ncbi:MAG TPA: hypothetical protein VLA37_05305 [Sphingomonadaceae bacterium]|nr:hypothetical protein [Sphingomonadaceae bacterium]